MGVHTYRQRTHLPHSTRTLCKISAIMQLGMLRRPRLCRLALCARALRALQGQHMDPPWGNLLSPTGGFCWQAGFRASWSAWAPGRTGEKDARGRGGWPNSRTPRPAEPCVGIRPPAIAKSDTESVATGGRSHRSNWEWRAEIWAERWFQNNLGGSSAVQQAMHVAKRIQRFFRRLQGGQFMRRSPCVQFCVCEDIGFANILLDLSIRQWRKCSKWSIYNRKLTSGNVGGRMKGGKSRTNRKFFQVWHR